MPLKIYEKGPVFLMGKTDLTSHSTKPAEDLFTIASASIYSKASQYFGVIEDCKNLLPPKQIRRNL